MSCNWADYMETSVMGPEKPMARFLSGGRLVDAPRIFRDSLFIAKEAEHRAIVRECVVRASECRTCFYSFLLRNHLIHLIQGRR